MFGYCGKLLSVDLSSGKTSEVPLDDATARKFLGGRGFGAKILFEEVPSGADPLGPENRLVVAAGPLAGTYGPGSGRLAVIGKSPLTGVFGEAYSGGQFAHELKYAGYDAVAVKGKAAEPVYVHLGDGKAELRSAAALMGKPTDEVETAITEELGDERYRIVSTGLAGEKGVRYACVMNDTDRAAGRTGLGAVMGAKNLKAIAVRGTGGVRVADPEGFRKASIADIGKIKSGALYPLLSGLGTSGITEMQAAGGCLPTRNWDSGTFEHAAKIGGTAMANSILVGRRACMACVLACTRMVQIKEGPFAGVRPEYGGPEYEAVAALGSLCGCSSLESIAMANQLCNVYGMDVISAGSAIAFAMDCFEKGILKEKDIGFPLPWGDAQGIVKLVHMIAKREGIGDLLAEGTAEAARRLGGDAPKLAVEVKGLELGMHDARGKKGLSLSYASAPRGATHCEGLHDTSFVQGDPVLGIEPLTDPFTLKGKAAPARQVENFASFVNSIPYCIFQSHGFFVDNSAETVQMLAAATGWKDFSLEESLAIGERNHNLARAFTVREGNGKADDRLPYKIGQKLKDGATKGQSISAEEIAAALQEYYQVRGWDSGGVPTQKKLKELGLDDVAKALHRKGGSK